MFGDDTFRRINEERFLIYQVINALPNKFLGPWIPPARIGDLYAQREKISISRFETIRNPEAPTTSSGQRPSTFFASKYYRKRLKQLKGPIERIRPFEPTGEGLMVVGHKLDLGALDPAADIPEEHEEAESHDLVAEPEVESVIKLSMRPRRLFFTTAPGKPSSSSIVVVNKGTTAVYFEWARADDVELTVGSGRSRSAVQRERFDWASSEAFDLARNCQAKTRSEFCFTQRVGSIKPGCSSVFNFSFKSDVPGCFTQRWTMKVTPSIPRGRLLGVALRGCCEVSPLSLGAFTSSIDASLAESERARCVDEILASVLDRVAKVCEMRKQHGDGSLEADVLVDDRAPLFEVANREWSFRYSPALYAAFMGIARQLWDVLGVPQFDRFWDLRVTSLAQMAMAIADGPTKRRILDMINAVIRMNMTQTAAGHLTFSIAYVQMATLVEDLPDLFLIDAAGLWLELPLFIVPRLPDPSKLEEAPDSGKRRHRGKRDRKQVTKKAPKKGAKAGDEDSSRAVTPNREATGEMRRELKAAIRATIRQNLRKRLMAFENLAGESRGVGQQLTRVNEIEKLETNLDVDVEDDV
jgi:hypothetical protein